MRMDGTLVVPMDVDPSMGLKKPTMARRIMVDERQHFYFGCDLCVFLAGSHHCDDIYMLM